MYKKVEIEKRLAEQRAQQCAPIKTFSRKSLSSLSLSMSYCARVSYMAVCVKPERIGFFWKELRGEEASAGTLRGGITYCSAQNSIFTMTTDGCDHTKKRCCQICGRSRDALDRSEKSLST